MKLSSLFIVYSQGEGAVEVDTIFLKLNDNDTSKVIYLILSIRQSQGEGWG